MANRSACDYIVDLGRTLSELDATHLGKLRVLDKADPLVFVADVVANSLHDRCFG
jgi:hypothetical protein